MPKPVSPPEASCVKGRMCFRSLPGRAFWSLLAVVAFPFLCSNSARCILLSSSPPTPALRNPEHSFLARSPVRRRSLGGRTGNIILRVRGFSGDGGYVCGRTADPLARCNFPETYERSGSFPSGWCHWQCGLRKWERLGRIMHPVNQKPLCEFHKQIHFQFQDTFRNV